MQISCHSEDARHSSSLRRQSCKFPLVVRICGKRYRHDFSWPYGAAFQHLGKYPLMGHDASTNLMIDGAVGVAFLSDLCYLQQRILCCKQRPNGKCSEIDPCHKKIFSESTVCDLCTLPIELLHLIVGQKTDLSVPWARMSITVDSVIFRQLNHRYRLFFRTFFFTDTGSFDDSLHTATPLL